MPPIRVNRRRFLGCSAAAGIALAQGVGAEGATEGAQRPVRLGVIGLGNRGTTLLRTALDLPGTRVVAVCDAEEKHRRRGQGIAEKAQGTRPEAFDRLGPLLERTDVDAVLVALPCDLHARAYCEAIRAGKAVYAEKPLAPTLAECDAVIAEAARVPDLPVHVGFQRRSNPRYVEGVGLIHRGDLGTLVEGRASWISSNGPVSGHDGWLADRARSGDWMVEQAVHVWDLLRWATGEVPVRAFGLGRRDVFAHLQPGRDVTDHYSVTLEWADGFHASFTQSWIDPADDAFTGNAQRLVGTAGGVDFGNGSATFRDKARPRLSIHPGAQADTRAALLAFLGAVRADGPVTPPVTLAEARDATLIGLLARKAIDGRRVVEIGEI